jgi:hypothetical protein
VAPEEPGSIPASVADLHDEDPTAVSELDEEVEVVDALPVPATAPAPEAAYEPPPLVPFSAQAAAVAVSGFAAGAVTVAVVKRRRATKALKRSTRARNALGTVVASRSFLVDVHLLGGRD